MKKKVGKGERVSNIVQLRGASMKKKLEYDHIENSLTFEDVLTKKRVTVKLLEGYLDQADYDDCKSMDTCYSRLWLHDQKAFIQEDIKKSVTYLEKYRKKIVLSSK